MSADSLKLIKHLEIGEGTVLAHLVHGSRMPGQGKIQILKCSISGHKCLTRTAFFSRTAIVNRSRMTIFQIFLDGQRCRCGTDTQQIVTTAMAAGSFCDCFFLDQIRYLT